MPLVALALLAAVAAVAVAARVRPDAARSRWARLRNAAVGDVRRGLLAGRAWPAIVLASALVVAGHVATFLIAARTAGATAPLSRMLPLVLLVLLAAALPNIGGWGPREGVTAWAFSAAGLGASLGRRDRGRLRRHGVRREPAGCRRARRGVGARACLTARTPC